MGYIAKCRSNCIIGVASVGDNAARNRYLVVMSCVDRVCNDAFFIEFRRGEFLLPIQRSSRGSSRPVVVEIPGHSKISVTQELTRSLSTKQSTHHSWVVQQSTC